MSRSGAAAVLPLVWTLIAGAGCDGSPGGVPDGGVVPPDGGSVLITGAAAEAAAGCANGPGLWIAGGAGGGAASTNTGWSERFGDSSDDLVNALGVGPDGGPVVVSTQYGVVDFGTGAYAMPANCATLLSAFSPSGALRWSRTVAAWSPDVVVGPDGGPFVTLTNNSVASLTPEGQVRWVWKTSLNLDFQLAVGASALYVVVEGGYTNGAYATTFQRLAFNGAAGWRFTFPAYGWPTFAVSSKDEVVFAIAFNGTVVIGDQTFQSAGAGDFVLAKLGADGKLRWARQFGSIADEVAPAVALSPDGSIVLLGFGGGGLDFGSGPLASANTSVPYLARVDAQGNAVAGRALADTWFGTSLRVTPSGQILVASNISSPISIEGTMVHTGAMGDGDFLVVETSPSFDAQKVLHFGNGGGNQSLTGISVDPQGGILLAGWFQGKLDLGAGLMRSAGGEDAFLGRVQP